MKTCTKCKLNKNICDFNKNSGRRDGLQNICRQCSKERSKQYYSDNTKLHKKNTLKRNKKIGLEIRNYIDFYKSLHSCVFCGEKEICCLDFHHKNGKKDFNIGKARSIGSLGKVKLEIKKCEIVCANCHRKLHKGLIDIKEIKNDLV